MTHIEELLRAYDRQLRTDAETPNAVDVTLLERSGFVKVSTTTPYTWKPHE